MGEGVDAKYGQRIGVRGGGGGVRGHGRWEVDRPFLILDRAAEGRGRGQQQGGRGDGRKMAGRALGNDGSVGWIHMMTRHHIAALIARAPPEGPSRTRALGNDGQWAGYI